MATLANVQKNSNDVEFPLGLAAVSSVPRMATRLGVPHSMHAERRHCCRAPAMVGSHQFAPVKVDGVRRDWRVVVLVPGQWTGLPYRVWAPEFRTPCRGSPWNRFMQPAKNR